MNPWINMKEAGELLLPTMDVKVVQAGEEITGTVLRAGITTSAGMLCLVVFDEDVTDPHGCKASSLLYTRNGELHWPDGFSFPGIIKSLTIVEVKDSDITK